MEGKDRKVTVEEWVDERWTNLDEDPTFHRKEYSPSLLKYHKKLFPGSTTGRIFLPLCGKTLDLIYLADQGHEVVGLEYSEGAIERFHLENSLTYTKETLQDQPFTVYSTKEKNIKIYQGDIFDLNCSICGQFDATFDRGSYVAINVDTHRRYADLMVSIMKPGGAILMESISYKSATFGGPPHSISKRDLEDNFSQFDLDILGRFESIAGPHIPVDDQKLIRTFIHLKLK